MDDVIFLVVFGAFMALSLGYVRLCDRIVRTHERGEQEAPS
jgi:hypothetical protein